MSLVRKRIVLPLIPTDIFQVIRPTQNKDAVLDLTYQQLLSALSDVFSEGGSLILLKTNGTDNPNQNILNLVAGTGVTLDVNDQGDVTINSFGGSFITSITDTATIDLDVTSGVLTGNLVDVGTAGTYGNGTQVPQVTIDSKGRVTNVQLVNITAGAGTVTSVGVNPGTGINATISGTSTINPTINITNTAPDVIVGLTGGNTIGVSGFYPNFTIRTNVTTNQRLLGRFTAGAGAYEEIIIGTNLTLTGNTLSATGGTGGTYTVDNGLSPQTTPTANPNNFQLGGALTKPTTITAAGSNTLTISSTNATPLAVSTTGSSQNALSLQSTTGAGLVVTSSDSVGIQSTSGQGNYAARLTVKHPTINNDILPVLLAYADPGTYPTTIGFGASFEFKLATTSSGVDGISNRLISKWTDATHATRTSQFEITSVNGAVESTALTLKGTGQLQLNKYTAGFSGTAAYALGVDASGNVITTTAGGGGSGTVTSVALSMPSAFTVAGSPILTSGTLAVTGAGTTSQYVRGDGSLATYNPGTGGGGASVSYYLNGSVNQTPTIGGLTYKQMSKTPVIGLGTDFTINADGYIQSFITDTGTPNQLLIPGGNWIFEMWFSASSGGGSPKFYIDVCTFDGTTLTTIGTSSATPENITGGTAIDLYTTAVAVPQTTLTLTDRIAIRVYVIHSSKTIKLHTEDSHLCEVITTFTTGLTALNGLTDQVQNFATPGTSGTTPNWNSLSPNHTLNIPLASTASVTAGLLSNTDYTTFSGKLSTTLNSANIFVGNGSNVATGVAMSGDTTISNTGAVTIANNAVTLAKFQQINTSSFLGRVTAATGNIEVLSGTQATTILDVFSSSLKGLAPSSGGGTTNFLRADGTWAAPSGGGNSILSLASDVVATASSPSQANVAATLAANYKEGSAGVTFDGGGAVISNGKIAYVRVPYKGTITAWYIASDVSGACSILVQQGLAGVFPPATTIFTAALPSGRTATNTVSVNVAAGDYLAFTISGVSTVTWVNLSLSITKIL